jgi:hypothetical protein
MKIEFELRMLLHLCLFEKKTKSRNYQDATVSSEESIANESWLQKVLAIELITVKMMILKQSKRRKALFRRRKFDILIRSILLKICLRKMLFII